MWRFKLIFKIKQYFQKSKIVDGQLQFVKFAVAFLSYVAYVQRH